MTVARTPIDRREALRRAALLLGSTISAPTLAAILAGCETPRDGRGWVLRALTAEQLDLVASIAERILPETDTPGATTAGVHRFIDMMLAECSTAAERARFIEGLADVDRRARRAGAQSFVRGSSDQQLAVLTDLDREAYSRAVGTPASDAVAKQPFFRTMKELTLLGYYTSEAGATKELRYVPVPGHFEGCVPMMRLGRAPAV